MPTLNNYGGENGKDANFNRRRKMELSVDYKVNSYSVEWGGFHAVGRTKPEKAYHKTVWALLEYVNIEKTNIIGDADLVRVLSFYWRGESYERVKQKLIDDGYITPITSGKYVIAQK